MSNRKKFYEACKKKLIEIKTKHLETMQNLGSELQREAVGDVGDQARQIQEENLAMARRRKIEGELQEIDRALVRMKEDAFGICEITGNEIEEKRLNAIPWTRLSLEGAEIQELEKNQEDNEEIA